MADKGRCLRCIQVHAPNVNGKQVSRLWMIQANGKSDSKWWVTWNDKNGFCEKMKSKSKITNFPSPFCCWPSGALLIDYRIFVSNCWRKCSKRMKLVDTIHRLNASIDNGVRGKSSEKISSRPIDCITYEVSAVFHERIDLDTHRCSSPSDSHSAPKTIASGDEIREKRYRSWLHAVWIGCIWPVDTQWLLSW